MRDFFSQENHQRNAAEKNGRKKNQNKEPSEAVCPTVMYRMCTYFILIGQALYNCYTDVAQTACGALHLGTSHLSTEPEIYDIQHHSSWTAWP